MRSSLARSVLILVALTILASYVVIASGSSQVAIVIHSNLYVFNAIPTGSGAELCLVGSSSIGVASAKPINGTTTLLTVAMPKGFSLKSCKLFPWGAIAVVELSSARIASITVVAPRLPGAPSRAPRVVTPTKIVAKSLIIVMNGSSGRWVEYVVKGVKLFDATDARGRIVAVGVDRDGHVVLLFLGRGWVKALNLSAEATRCLKVEALGNAIELVCVNPAGTMVIELRGDRAEALEVPLLNALLSYVSMGATYLASRSTIAILEPSTTTKLVELHRSSVVQLMQGTALIYNRNLGDIVIDLTNLEAYRIVGAICSEAQVLTRSRVFALCSSVIVFANLGSRIELYGSSIAIEKARLNASISAEKARRLEVGIRKVHGVNVSVRYLEPTQGTLALSSFVSHMATESTVKEMPMEALWIGIAVAISIAIALIAKRVVKKG